MENENKKVVVLAVSPKEREQFLERNTSANGLAQGFIWLAFQRSVKSGKVVLYQDELGEAAQMAKMAGLDEIAGRLGKISAG